jgi:alpha-mannosidase
MNTIHIISHTHWDREWYRTFQQFRLKLVALVDGLLDILERDQQYRYFMLDGQTIILDDYLQMRPAREAILRKHIRNGRILIGPWHILPDMFLVGPEAHIRNLLQGARTARHFGSRMDIGYIPDPFGHPGQMPQMLRGFGMDVACLWRGVDITTSEFWWQSPDGLRVLMVNLRDGYGNGAKLPADDPRRFSSQLEERADSLLPDSTTSNLLVMYGADHMEPPPNTSAAIARADELLNGRRVIHSTLPQYVQSVKRELGRNAASLPIVEGELRSCRRMPLLPGVLSSRMWIKQRNQTCEALLVNWVEPFTTFQELAAPQSTGSTVLNEKSDLIRQAWRLLMENHPHDSICGCSIDQVHEEMKVRFDQVEQVGEELARQGLETLAGAIDTLGGLPSSQASSALVVFNPLAGPRTDVVTATLLSPIASEFDLVDEDGTPLPYQEQGLGAHEIANMTMDPRAVKSAFSNVKEGRAVGMTIQDLRMRREGAEVFIEAVLTQGGEPNMPAWDAGRKQLDVYLADPSITTYHARARSISSQLTVVVSEVPGYGYRTLWIRPRQVEARPPMRLNPLFKMLLPLGSLPFVQRLATRRRRSKPPYRIESDLFVVEAHMDGTVSLQDKRDGRAYSGLNYFRDGGDCGDEYNYAPPEVDLVAVPRLKNVSISRRLVQQVLELEMELVTPAALAQDRRSRSKEKVAISIKTTVRLSMGVPRVDIHTSVDNHAHDHRLLVHFPAPFPTGKAWHDGHFEVVEREVGVPACDATWVEQPRPEVPQRAFTSITDGQSRLTVANRGLPEVEVITNEKGNAEIALTLLRCVGWLSRDDLPTRKGHAGPPYLETPGAQMPGRWEFEYAVIPGLEAVPAYWEAYSFQAPMRTVGTNLHSGGLPIRESFVAVEPGAFRLSAIKQAEDGKGWLVRGVNLTGEEIQVTLKPWKFFRNIEQVDLAEHKVTGLKRDRDGKVTLLVRGHEIASVMFRR